MNAEVDVVATPRTKFVGRFVQGLRCCGPAVRCQTPGFNLWKVIENKQTHSPVFNSGGALEQIQFLLGHASVQTTERYLGGKQELQVAVNDKLGVGVP